MTITLSFCSQDRSLTSHKFQTQNKYKGLFRTCPTSSTTGVTVTRSNAAFALVVGFYSELMRHKSN